MGEWKLLMDDDGGHKELFRITEDRAEENNVAGMYPEIVSRLEQRVLQWEATLPD